MTRTKARRGNHYCLDEIGDLTWTTRKDDSHAPPYVVCAVCGRPRGETINERDAMKRRLHSLASNLRVAAGLERAFHVGSMFGMRASIEGRHTKAWTSNTDGKAAP